MQPDEDPLYIDVPAPSYRVRATVRSVDRSNVPEVGPRTVCFACGGLRSSSVSRHIACGGCSGRGYIDPRMIPRFPVREPR
jgi:hypothetical protein